MIWLNNEWWMNMNDVWMNECYDWIEWLMMMMMNIWWLINKWCVEYIDKYDMNK